MENAKKKGIKKIDTRKLIKIVGIAAAVIVVGVVLFFVIRGNKHCSSCYGYCNGSHSFEDGKVILCGDCYKDWFETKSEMNPSEFFAD